jgi:hypothetical protein
MHKSALLPVAAARLCGRRRMRAHCRTGVPVLHGVLVQSASRKARSALDLKTSKRNTSAVPFAKPYAGAFKTFSPG